ncbi:tRNA dihydrouridine synthase DusB [Corynebacterium uterequi]|uniref:tRNA dihydrouridine synthase DusB n=1 Tax=Corynebacterium uterequi TaxID=1072256 RepID=UPI0038B2E779
MTIGTVTVNSPVVLAPMAGVTNVAFRTLCRELEQQRTGTVSGLYVCEMITARALVERNEKTLHMTAFGPTEDVRSMQLYAVDPEYTYRAARMIAEENMADHLDLNFGCAVPKITRRGGGAAIPYKRKLFGSIINAAVKGVEGTGIPVTAKFRIGIDDEHRTHLDAGRIAVAEGASAVTLHARTAAQRYSGTADFDAIRELVAHLDGTGVPVLGNGDIFAARDARTMMDATGCHGVVVGRGCLGRPWLFAALGAELRGEPLPAEPTLGEVTRIILRHAELLSDHLGEQHACRDIRKHMGWYMRGFPVGGKARAELTKIASLDDLRAKLAPYEGSVERAHDADAPRGRQGSPAPVHLPDGWLDDPEDGATVLDGGDAFHSGG